MSDKETIIGFILSQAHQRTPYTIERTAMNYKKHNIKRTDITTRVSIPKPFGRSGVYEATRYLYEIDGEHAKSAGTRPFITTLQSAKEYITDSIEENSTFRIVHHQYLYNCRTYNSKTHHDEFTDLEFDSREEAESYLQNRVSHNASRVLGCNEYAPSNYTIEIRR